MKCIAIDDEPMALEIISSFCKRHGNLELTTFNNPIAGINQVKGRNRMYCFWTSKWEMSAE